MDIFQSRDRIAAEARAAAEKGCPINPYPAGTEAHQEWQVNWNARTKELWSPA